MNKKILTVAIITSLVAGGGGFVGGMKYQESKVPNFAAGDLGRSRASNNTRAGIPETGLKPINGIVTSKDDSSITIESEDGSSKIVFFAESSSINRTETVGKDAIKEGDKVSAFGQENSDGSLTAKSIQLNPALMVNSEPPNGE